VLKQHNRHNERDFEPQPHSKLFGTNRCSFAAF
jgi:hypothetical protein